MERDRPCGLEIQVQMCQILLNWGWIILLWTLNSLLECLGPFNVDYVLEEIQGGICDNHSKVRSLANKALRASYYCLLCLPTLKRKWESVTNIRGSPGCTNNSRRSSWCYKHPSHSLYRALISLGPCLPERVKWSMQLWLLIISLSWWRLNL